MNRRLRTALPCLLGVCTALLGAPALQAATPAWAGPATVDECHASGAVARTLVAAPAASGITDARALWVDGARFVWPGADPALRTRLLRSADGTIVAVAGEPARGADAELTLRPFDAALPPALAERFRWAGPGPLFAVEGVPRTLLTAAHRGQLVAVQEDAAGRVVRATALQHAAALDALYAAAETAPPLGATVERGRSTLRLWAPTARQVALCLFAPGAPVGASAAALHALQRDEATGVWSVRLPRDLSGWTAVYLVDVWVRGHGVMRQRVTDPYALSLTEDSRRGWIGRLDDPRSQPAGWRRDERPAAWRAKAPATDRVLYELHVRDFSIDDATVPAAHRGTYLAFTHAGSDGMRHLKRLAAAGLTDVHLLPVFDIASVPEAGCLRPDPAQLRADVAADPASPLPQQRVTLVAAQDCFNWGYDPLHFTAPEGSYATDAEDPWRRLVEFRAMVQALHRAGLRVGMDMVYNHTSAAGQQPQSVLDRIVPGYYHRLNAKGEIERSTCCDNTATEHRMMARLMIDSAVVWARDFRIDAMRFDLMGHQPRDAMLRLQAAVDRAAGRRVHLIGEGWNFGEVENGRRFVQAAQGRLGGTGIGTFNDRLRDALRGGGAGDSGAALVERTGWTHGPQAGGDEALGTAADLVRAGLAGTLRSFRFVTRDGSERTLAELRYGSAPAGYADEPEDTVNYAENHDNLTLFDSNVFKLPPDTPPAERARVQLLALAAVAFAQGVPYFHAGGEVLRSKSLDRNSYDSGDWFNRIDWTLQDNGFGSGLPPERDNAQSWPQMAPLLARRDAIRPRPEDIRFTRDAFADLLRIRASSTLFRLPTARQVRQRLAFHASGGAAGARAIVATLDGRGLPGARWAGVLYALNADTAPQTLSLPALAGRRFALHPVHQAPGAADLRPREAAWDPAAATLTVPPRTAVVFVAP